MAATIQVQLRQTSGATSEASIRTHKILVDRPEAKGGTDLGPMGGELFLTSVGGCFMSNLLAAIKARGVKLASVQTSVTGTVAEAPARFSSIEMEVTAEGPDRESLEKLVEIADRGCIMMNTLRGLLDVKIRIGAPV